MDTQPVLAYLRVLATDGSDHVVSITSTPFCIGRGDHNELSLVEDQISRHHACVRLEDNKFYLVDMGSENGTWIGTNRLENNRPYVLDYHTAFRIGTYLLQLEPVSGGEPAWRRPRAAETVPLSAAAPIAAESQAAGGHAQPVIAPLVESSPSHRFGVLLKTPQIDVTPGVSTNASLVIINQSQSSDGFRIAVSGIPDQWLSAPPPLVELPADARQEVNLTIHPPRSPENRAGSYRLLVQVTNQNAPAETVEVWANLMIEPYSAFESTLRSPRIGPNETAQIIVRNNGNAATTFTLTWNDPEERYEFRPLEVQMEL